MEALAKAKAKKGRARAWLTYKTMNGKRETTHQLVVDSAKDFVDVFIKVAKSGKQITFFEYVGHGGVDGVALEFEKGSFGIGKNDLAQGWYGIESYKNILTKAFHPNATIELEGCQTNYSSYSIAPAFKNILPNATVKGWTGLSQKWPIAWETHRHVLNPTSRFVGVK